MVKLSPELINSCMQFINPCRDRELDLRGTEINSQTIKIIFRGKNRLLKLIILLIDLFTGYKIPEIQNMGATLDQFDTIDFSDNDLRRLGGFPFLNRLKCLLLNNNRIT
jgi:U2 small nuclear ribonucleoprotein A'